MHHKHSQIGEEQLVALVDAGRRPNAFLKALDCLFCDTWDVYLRNKEHPPRPPQEPVPVDLIKFRRHVGSHMQDLALFATPRGYLEGDGDADSAASARAAGAGKNSASVARSRIALSMDSYDTAPYFEPPKSSGNVEAYALAIDKSFRLPTPAFEHQSINALPSLSVPELEDLRTRCDLTRKVKSVSDVHFRIIIQAAYCGPLETMAECIEIWNTYPLARGHG